MRKNKKRYIFIFAGLGVVLLIVAAVVWNHYREQANSLTQTVMVSSWNDDSRYAICKIYGKDSVATDCREAWTGFHTSLSLDELVAQNSDYIGDVLWEYMLLDWYEAKLYFAHNNYYVLYKTEADSDEYQVRCCYGSWSVHEADITFPIPLYFLASESMFELCTTEMDVVLIEYLFENYTFEYMKDFYERYSGNIAKIDEENQKIYITGYDMSDKCLREYCLCMDYQNGVMVYDDGESEIVETNGDYINITERE